MFLIVCLRESKIIWFLEHSGCSIAVKFPSAKWQIVNSVVGTQDIGVGNKNDPGCEVYWILYFSVKRPSLANIFYFHT